MSRLEELIQELCPDGVEFDELGNLLISNIGGGTPTKSNPSYWNGDIPWASVKDIVAPSMYLTDTVDYITELGLKKSNANIAEKGSIIVATRINPGKMLITRIDAAINQDLRILRLKGIIDSKYLVYYFQTLTIVGKGTTVKGISIQELERIRIPIPPLPIQREIVRILDQFAELTAELTAELEKRKLQYEYYRDYLLTFDDTKADNVLNRQIRWITLSQNGKFYGGLTGKIKSDFSNGNAKFISYMNVFSNYDVKAAKQTVKVGKNERQNHVEYGDILFTGSSESREEAGLTSVMTFRPEEPYYLNSFCIGYKPNRDLGLLPEFSKYLFRSKHIRKQIIRIANGVTRFNISRVKLGDIKIPIPPLEEQRRIVAILDRFDVLCNDLTSGLPAEIEARRKQYEYYRDKLLTFKEKTA